MSYQATLKQAQLNNYKKGVEKHQNDKSVNHPIIADKSNGNKNYRSLTQIWMPLILDHPDANPSGEPWTVDEIINAMMPIIRSFAREYGRLKASYQTEDGISDGQMAVLYALEMDGGRAPFGNFAATTIKRAIQKGVKGSNLIPIATRNQSYSDAGASSIDKSIGDDPRITMSGSLPSNVPTIAKVKCPQCGGIGRLDAEGNPDSKGEKCPLCKGSGKIAAADSKEKPTKPDDIKDEQERISKARSVVSAIISQAELSPRQTEIYLLKYGLEGLYDPKLRNTNEEKHPTAIANIIAAADTIHKVAPPQINVSEQPDSGIWPEAIKQDKIDLFQEIWDDAFNPMDHEPFNPKLPASLQIAPLVGVREDEAKMDRLSIMVDRMQKEIANIPLQSRSKQFAANQLKKTQQKIDAVKDELNPYEEYMGHTGQELLEAHASLTRLRDLILAEKILNT